MVSINDVAKHAGVSNATVSRVLANYPHVTEETRQRVLGAIEELGYQPDKTARRLRSQNVSQVIGLIVSDIQNPHFSGLVRGIEDYAYQHNLNIILCNAAESFEREEYYVTLMQSERAAGVLINPTSPKAVDLLHQLRKHGTSVVLLDNVLEGFPADSIGVNDREGAYRATKHLLQHGYKRVGTIAGRQTQTTGRQRLRGYLDALHESGISVDQDLIVESDYTTEAGYHATQQLIKQGKPDAIFTCNNAITVGTLQALKQLGLMIPEDIALVSFDDLPNSEFFATPLTAVAQPSYDIGLEAGRLIQKRIQNPDAPYMNHELPIQLIVRESCGSGIYHHK